MTAADAVGELSHLVEHAVNLRHYVLAIDDDGRAFRRTQRHVQDGAILRDVDLLASKHRVDSLAQAALLGEFNKQPEGLIVDAIFRIIQEDAGGLCRHALAARGIIRKKFPQMHVTNLPMMSE